jgi:hypothetical protein
MYDRFCELIVLSHRRSVNALGRVPIRIENPVSIN